MGFLGNDEREEITYNFFTCEKLSSVFTFGGEELEIFTTSNYYEVRKLNITDLYSIDISAKNMMLKAYNKEYEQNIIKL